MMNLNFWTFFFKEQPHGCSFPVLGRELANHNLSKEAHNRETAEKCEGPVSTQPLIHWWMVSSVSRKGTRTRSYMASSQMGVSQQEHSEPGRWPLQHAVL